MKGEKALAWVAFAIVCVVWGTTYLAIRIAIETIPPLLMTGARFTIGGAVILLFARFRGEAIPRDFRTLANLAFVGFLMVGIGNLAVVWAEQWVPSGMAALLVATAPFWMAMLQLMRRDGERLDLRGSLGIAAGFLGVVLLVTPRSAGASFGQQFMIGALAIQLGAIAWQIGSLRSKYSLKDVPLLSSAALQMLFGGAQGISKIGSGHDYIKVGGARICSKAASSSEYTSLQKPQVRSAPLSFSIISLTSSSPSAAIKFTARS